MNFILTRRRWCQIVTYASEWQLARLSCLGWDICIFWYRALHWWPFLFQKFWCFKLAAKDRTWVVDWASLVGTWLVDEIGKDERWSFHEIHFVLSQLTSTCYIPFYTSTLFGFWDLDYGACKFHKWAMHLGNVGTKYDKTNWNYWHI
jgi:hypothetical protein